jgi:hypothetical protein
LVATAFCELAGSVFSKGIVCMQNEVGCGLVLAAGFLFDLEIFLKIFLEFPPPRLFLTLKLFI